MEKSRIISGKYFREHPFCIKSGTLVELIDKVATNCEGARFYFDGYDTYGARKVNDYFGLWPVFKCVAKDGGINRSRSHFVDASGFTFGRYDLKVIREPED